MSTRSQKVSLTAGQQATIYGDGTISITLVDGVVEIAGVILSAKQQYPFRLSDDVNITMYTLEGGSVVVAHNTSSSIDVFKASTELAPLVSLARRDAARGKPVVVAVIGGQRTGKSHAAQTYANALAQAGAKRGTPQGVAGVYYADASGALTPGSLTVMEMYGADGSPSEVSWLWPCHASAPHHVSCSFWFGGLSPAGTVGAASMPLFLHGLSQLQACSDAMAKNQTAIIHSTRPHGHVVYDLPTTDGTLPRELFYQRVVDILRPTVLIITESDGVTREWARSVEEHMRRISPLSDVATIIQNARLSLVSGSPSTTSTSSHLRRSVQDYFGGTVMHPLGSSKVVAPLSKLRWFRVCQSASNGAALPTTEAVEPSSSVVEGRLCALSHALLDSEIPLANICGVVYIARVDEEHDECVMIVPSGDLVLPTNMLVLPPFTAATNTLPWRMEADAVAIIEDTLAA